MPDTKGLAPCPWCKEPSHPYGVKCPRLIAIHLNPDGSFDRAELVEPWPPEVAVTPTSQPPASPTATEPTLAEPDASTEAREEASAEYPSSAEYP